MPRIRISLLNDKKKDEFTEKIRNRLIEKYGNSPNTLKIINTELAKFASLQSIKKKDVDDVETILKSFSPVKETNKKDSPNKKDQKLDFHNTEIIQIEPTPKNLVLNGDTTITTTTINNPAINTINFGKAINSDLNGLSPLIHKEKSMSQSSTTPIIKIKRDSVEGMVHLTKSGLYNSDTALTQTDDNNYSATRSPIKYSLVDQEKLKKQKLWAKIQDYEVKKFIEDEEDRKKKHHDDQISMANYLANQIELRNELQGENNNIKTQCESKIIKDDLRAYQLINEQKKKHMENAREQARKSVEDMNNLLQEKLEIQRELKKIEVAHRLEEENKYMQELAEMRRIREREKAMVRQQQQKVIEQRSQSLKELKKHEQEDDKRELEDLIQRQKKVEIQTALFYENIRKRTTDHIGESKNAFLEETTSTKTKKNQNEPFKASLPIGLRNVDPNQKAKLDKEQREMIAIQNGLRQSKLKEHKEQMNEQKELWQIEEEIMDAREDYIKEMEKAKKVVIKQELDKQIIQKEIEKNALYHPKDVLTNRKLVRQIDISSPKIQRSKPVVNQSSVN